MKPSDGSLSVDETADLLGLSDARVSQLRGDKLSEEPTLAELEANELMQRRIRLAEALVGEGEAVVATTAIHRRILAVSRCGLNLFWRTSASMFGAKLESLVREAGEPAAEPEASNAALFARAFSPLTGSGHLPIQVRVLPNAWWVPPRDPELGLGYVTATHDPPPGFEPSAQQRALVERAEQTRPRRNERHPERPWRFYPIAGGYPSLGEDAVCCELTYRDVDPGGAAIPTARISARRERQSDDASTAGSRAAIRLYKFARPSIRVGITREILGLEYSVRSLVTNDADFGPRLRELVMRFFQNKVDEIGKRFMAEYVTLFNFRIARGGEPSSFHSGSPRVLLPLGTYGMPRELSELEAFPLREGEGGHVGEFFRKVGGDPYLTIDFTSREEQDKARQPNVINLEWNSRFSQAHNALLVKVRLPPKEKNEETQSYGCLRLVNMFEASDGARPFEPAAIPKRPEWLPELVEITEHLAIMYQQWLRISRRWILKRAVEDLNEGSNLVGYVRSIKKDLRALSEFEYVAVWEVAAGGLRYLEHHEGLLVPFSGTFAGSVCESPKPLIIEQARDGYRTLASEQSAMQRSEDALRPEPQPEFEGQGSRSSTMPPPPRPIVLRNGFEFPLMSSANKQPWGVMSFYNTWSSPEDSATLYRDETLEFCKSLANLIAAKRDLPGPQSTPAASSESRPSRPPSS